MIKVFTWTQLVCLFARLLISLSWTDVIFQAPALPTPMRIDHSLPRDQCWGDRILDQRKKQKKRQISIIFRKAQRQVSEQQSHKTHLDFSNCTLLFQEGTIFMWMYMENNLADFEHHFLTTAPSVLATWWKARRGEKKSISEPNWKRWIIFQREEEEVSNKTSHDTKGWEKDNKQVGKICCLSATLLSGNGITLDTSRAYQTAPHIRPLGETGRACFVCSNWVLCAGP